MEIKPDQIALRWKRAALNNSSAVWSYDASGLANPSVNPPAVSNGVVHMSAGQQQSTYMYGGIYAFTLSGERLFTGALSQTSL